MLCTGSGCDRAARCGLYYRNPQPDNRKYDNVESLASCGSGSISSEGCHVEHWCGPLGDYKMFEHIPDQVLYEKIANEINSLGFGITVGSENIKSMVDQFRKVDCNE